MKLGLWRRSCSFEGLLAEGPTRDGLVLVAALVLVAVGLGRVAEAHAQDAAPSVEEVPAPVLELLRRGVEARVQGDDEAALDAFREAHVLAPALGRASAQLGLAHHALGHWLEAEALLSSALESDDPWIGRNREAIEGSLAVVRTHLATIEVSAPEGAWVSLDGEGEGALAPRSLRVVEGTHRLRARLEGHDDAEASLDARGGRVELVRLLPRPIAVATEPPIVEVMAVAVEPTPHDDALRVDALVWVGLASTLVGLGAAIGGHVLAQDAQRGRAATLEAECTGATPSCEALHDRLASELVPYEIVVNAAWGLTALGGVLAAVGLGLTLTSHEAPASVRLTPSGLRGWF